MIIETKFNIGQEVWLISSNKICKLKIDSLIISSMDNRTNIKYGFGKTDYTHILELIEESKLFTTKEELLKSLEYD